MARRLRARDREGVRARRIERRARRRARGGGGRARVSGVVAEPSEVTPMTASMLGQLCIEAGLPPGVLNIVQGFGPRAGGPLIAHAGVRAISFTGSTRVGGEIVRVAAQRFAKVSLEMGGKNPNLIFADADLSRAIPEALRA